MDVQANSSPTLSKLNPRTSAFQVQAVLGQKACAGFLVSHVAGFSYHMGITMNEPTHNPPTSSEPQTGKKSGFLMKFFQKLDAAMKKKAEEKSKQGSCCGGNDHNDKKGGKCC